MHKTFYTMALFLHSPLYILSLAMIALAVVAFALGLWGSRYNDCAAQPRQRGCVLGKRPAFWYSLAQICFIGAIALNYCSRPVQ